MRRRRSSLRRIHLHTFPAAHAKSQFQIGPVDHIREHTHSGWKKYSSAREGSDVHLREQALMSEGHSEPLTYKQRIFVAALLLLGTLIAFGVVYYLNPNASLSRAGAPSGTDHSFHPAENRR
jgi:hypothetical protein